MKVKLTQYYIDNPPPVPPGKRKEEHCDTALPGLLFEQRATNCEWGTFRLRYKNAAGKTSYAAIGRSCDITLQEARERARKLKAEIQLGSDPAAQACERRQVPTWDTYFNDQYLPHAKQHKRSWKNDEEMHRLRISQRFGSARINKITRGDVQQWLNELHDSELSPATCDHHAKLIRQALNLAVQWDLLEGNPVAGIKLFGGDNRIENVMTRKQLQRLIHVLDNAPKRRKVASLVIKFLLFTGARVNEALNAQWKDIDLRTRTWVVHAPNSKSKQRRSIPLNDAAVAVLDTLDSKGRSEWLFTSSRTDGLQRMTTINKVWREIRKDAEMPWLRLHDLRHNFASMLVNSGRTLYEVQQILGHSNSKVTERYAHLSTERLQEAANSASSFLEQHIHPQLSSEQPLATEEKSYEH